MTETIGVDLARAVALSRACFDLAIDLRLESDRLVAELRRVGEEPSVLVPALATVEWAATETRRIAALVETIVGWGPEPSAACGAWRFGPAALVPDDGLARSAGREALDALRGHDVDRFERIVQDWSGNATFLRSLGSDLDVDDIVPWLLLAAEPDAHVAEIGDGGASVLDVVGYLSTSLAAATAAGTAPFSLAELLERGAATGLTTIGAAMLFVAPGGTTRAWSSSWLVDAVVLVVLPLTAQARVHGARSVGRRWGDELVDLRARIFDALAVDPGAARQAFATVDLRDLVRVSAGYLDGGRALADALVVATRPDGVENHVAGTIMWRFIDALSLDDPPPALLTECLGQIAWPWIGSFRVDRADRRSGGVASSLPGPDEAALRRYLALAASSEVATADLQGALDHWVAFHLALSGAGPASPLVLHDIGAVSRFVSEATRDFERARAITREGRRSSDRLTIQTVGDGVGMVTTSWVGEAVGFVITKVAAPRIAPTLDAEIEHLVSVPTSVAHDQELLEWRVLAHLWRHRAASGLFDALPEPPPAVLDPVGQLVPPSALDDQGWAAYQRWRDLVADATGLDNVGAAYGRDVPPSIERAGPAEGEDGDDDH